MQKPKYLIIYKNEKWKLDFFKKRLINFKLINFLGDLYNFEHFEVHFVKMNNIFTYLEGYQFFGIIAEENSDITNEIVDNELVPLISNPFIGAVHVMK